MTTNEDMAADKADTQRIDEDLPEKLQKMAQREIAKSRLMMQILIKEWHMNDTDMIKAEGPQLKKMN